jgi:uncharacterized protein HemX
MLGMEQSKINEAVKNCVREALDQDDPLTALQSAIDRLAASGWPKAEIDTIRNAAIRMLSVIYDVGGQEADDQAE